MIIWQNILWNFSKHHCGNIFFHEIKIYVNWLFFQSRNVGYRVINIELLFRYELHNEQARCYFLFIFKLKQVVIFIRYLLIKTIWTFITLFLIYKLHFIINMFTCTGTLRNNFFFFFFYDNHNSIVYSEWISSNKLWKKENYKIISATVNRSKFERF